MLRWSLWVLGCFWVVARVFWLLGHWFTVSWVFGLVICHYYAVARGV